MRANVSIALAAVLIGGCISNSYDVELTPRGPVVERKLGFERHRSQDGKVVLELPEPDELPRLARAYQVAEPERDKRRYEFRGEFRGRMPDDVGNAGSLTHWHTQFGSATVYLERFRGRNDLVADLEIRRAAAEQFCDLIAGWLEKELKADPRWPQLKAFLAGDFRRDLQNVGLYVWMLGAGRHETYQAPDKPRTLFDAQPHDRELVARLQQYLAERGYLTVDQWPELVRGIQEPSPQRLLLLLQRQVANRLGYGLQEPLPPTLGFLADETRLSMSLEEYLRTTEEFRRLPAKPDSPPQPREVLEEPLARLLELFFDVADSLKVRLNLPSPPLATNGRWEPNDKAVRWSTTVAGFGSPEPWPATIYALWCEPNATTQQKVFGRTVLTGESLLEYCFWRASLTEAEGRQWDEFVGGLTPGPTLAEKLNSFRFPGETDDGSRVSESLRAPILKNLP